MQKIFLHCCCAVCSCSIIEGLLDKNLTLFFYNPNIHPVEEYEKRKEELLGYAAKRNVPVIDADYDSTFWFDSVKGLEEEPERGARCTKCFEMRLYKTAEVAYTNKIPLFATTLGISRWKDLEQVNSAGRWAASHFQDVEFWDRNWRRDGGVTKMAEISKEEQFYRQTYCGCLFSKR